jgi:nitrilase
VGGYPKGLDFGARVGLRTDQGREDFRRYFDSALKPHSPAFKKIAETAKKNKVHLVTGVMEKQGGTLYCSVFFFSPQGEFLGKHRKLMPTASERLIWGFGDGSTMPVLETELGRMGAVICWENYMPLLRTYMYSKQVQLYLAPTVDSRETWLPSMRHIALEGRCFVLTACQYLLRKDCPQDYPLDESVGREEALIQGGSAIISPMGEILAGPKQNQETILTADLDLNQITRGKYDLDATGHYARPDVFQLKVNLRPQKPVMEYKDASKDPFLD